jgi:hypothetical protein
MPSQWAAFRSFILVLGLASGCASDALKNNLVGDSQLARKSNDTKSHDDFGDTDADIDQMFRETNTEMGAGQDRPTRNEDDPLRDLFESQRAQEIERHLGIE